MSILLGSIISELWLCPFPYLHHLFIGHTQVSLGQTCLLQLGCWLVLVTNEGHYQDVLLDEHWLGAGDASTLQPP